MASVLCILKCCRCFVALGDVHVTGVTLTTQLGQVRVILLRLLSSEVKLVAMASNLRYQKLARNGWVDSGVVTYAG